MIRSRNYAVSVPSTVVTTWSNERRFAICKAAFDQFDLQADRLVSTRSSQPALRKRTP